MISAAALIMNAARPVTRFTSDVLGIFAGSLNAGMFRGFEIAYDVRMAFRASVRTDKFCARDLRRGDGGAGQRGAGKKHNREEETSSGDASHPPPASRAGSGSTSGRICGIAPGIHSYRGRSTYRVPYNSFCNTSLATGCIIPKLNSNSMQEVFRALPKPTSRCGLR